ncbi:MAG: hypothetical protein N2255_01405, partial [Kiritimatiellae bacterium]|nr:hypothetical protein [Kiritimatiellia bacterium]
MGDLEQSARRILGAYGRCATDRIPICPPISWHPMRNIDVEKPTGWRSDPDFVRVARLVEEHCDFVPPFNAVKYPPVFSGISYQRFLEAPDEYIEVLSPERVSATRVSHTTVLH